MVVENDSYTNSTLSTPTESNNPQPQYNLPQLKINYRTVDLYSDLCSPSTNPYIIQQSAMGSKTVTQSDIPKQRQNLSSTCTQDSNDRQQHFDDGSMMAPQNGESNANHANNDCAMDSTNNQIKSLPSTQTIPKDGGQQLVDLASFLPSDLIGSVVNGADVEPNDQLQSTQAMTTTAPTVNSIQTNHSLGGKTMPYQMPHSTTDIMWCKSSVDEAPFLDAKSVFQCRKRAITAPCKQLNYGTSSCDDCWSNAFDGKWGQRMLGETSKDDINAVTAVHGQHHQQTNFNDKNLESTSAVSHVHRFQEAAKRNRRQSYRRHVKGRLSCQCRRCQSSYQTIDENRALEDAHDWHHNFSPSNNGKDEQEKEQSLRPVAGSSQLEQRGKQAVECKNKYLVGKNVTTPFSSSNLTHSRPRTSTTPLQPPSKAKTSQLIEVKNNKNVEQRDSLASVCQLPRNQKHLNPSKKLINTQNNNQSTHQYETRSIKSNTNHHTSHQMCEISSRTCSFMNAIFSRITPTSSSVGVLSDHVPTISVRDRSISSSSSSTGFAGQCHPSWGLDTLIPDSQSEGEDWAVNGDLNSNQVPSTSQLSTTSSDVDFIEQFGHLSLSQPLNAAAPSSYSVTAAAGHRFGKTAEQVLALSGE